MKKKGSILIVSILILSLAGASIAQLRSVSILESLKQVLTQEEAEDLDKDIRLDEVSSIQENSGIEETKLREKLLRLDAQGDVTVAITFLNPAEDNENYLNFEVILDTHSVELDKYNLAEMTTISIGDEIKITDGIEWKPSGGGHHISGSLNVPRKYEGAVINYIESDFMELEIKELDKIASRKFRWKKDELEL